MNLREKWTSTTPRLIASCALSVLLASSTGCVGDALATDPSEQLESPSEQPDSLDSSDAGPSTGSGDAGVTWSDDDVNQGCEPGYADAGKPYPPKPGESDAGGAPPRTCTGHLIGDGKVCISDLDLKLKGLAFCEAQGLELTDLKPGEADCAGGSTEGWVSCCAPPAPTAATACTGGVIGDGSSCIDWTSLKLKASGACEALGASLVGLAGSSDGQCLDGALWAKYECCTLGALPPKPASAGNDGWLK